MSAAAISHLTPCSASKNAPAQAAPIGRLGSKRGHGHYFSEGDAAEHLSREAIERLSRTRVRV